jgi:hypothetical protein
MIRAAENAEALAPPHKLLQTLKRNAHRSLDGQALIVVTAPELRGDAVFIQKLRIF